MRPQTRVGGVKTMAFRVTRKTLNTTPAALFGTDNDKRLGSRALVSARASGTIHLHHAADGTTSNSFRWDAQAGDTLEVDVEGEQLYGFVASSTLDVDVLEQGV